MTSHVLFALKFSASWANDIALLKLATVLSFTRFVGRVCLPNSDYIAPSGLQTIATGFGSLGG